VAFELFLRPRPGYPFPLRLEVAYELTGEGLEVVLAAENVGDAAAPFGTGLHPYFAASAGRVDRDRLQLPAGFRLAVDDALIPTGERLPVVGTAYDFRAPRAIGALALDDCFTDLERDGDGLARIRLTGERREITVWMDNAFGHVQLFTGDGLPEPERRRSVAIEPMTCAPDAFNSGDGLIVLAPGERVRARFGMHASVA
jgi:aldose 1-epimerase